MPILGDCLSKPTRACRPFLPVRASASISPAVENTMTPEQKIIRAKVGLLELAKQLETDLWATPQWLYDKLDTEFHFTVDLCATPENAKCERFYTKSENSRKSLIDFIEFFSQFGPFFADATVALDLVDA